MLRVFLRITNQVTRLIIALDFMRLFNNVIDFLLAHEDGVITLIPQIGLLTGQRV